MHGLLKTLLRPDREEDPERTLIARAANVLQVGEFQFLQLAYADWHGRDMPADLCSAMFKAYMLHNEVPVWARHFARWVIRQDEIGMIDGQNPKFHRYDHDYVTDVPQGMRKFVIATMIIAFVLVSGILIGHMAGVQSASVLPPYFESEEFGSAR
ncbi:MAG: hypothetical protein MI920_34730 [Kiloniellales bacterium]|nr:hypothetical protein [Kiloniellales bacterium]